MRYCFTVLALLGFGSFAYADDRACIISFDTARYDVCVGTLSPLADALQPLADFDEFAASPLRIVKFSAPVGLAQRQALERLGAEILGYVPHYAYLVRMPASLDNEARAIDGVAWTGPYLPIWKLDINLANDLSADANAGKGTSIIEQGQLNRLTVALHPGAEANRALGELSAVSGISYQLTERGYNHQRYVVGFERNVLISSVRSLASHNDVASVSLRWDNEFMNSQAGWLHQSGESTSLPIFEQGIFGCGQIVAAADSGVHEPNCAFRDNDYGLPVTSVCANGSNCAAVTPDFDHRKIGAHYKWDGSTSGVPADNQGHGTHVMGSLTGNNPASSVDCENLTSPGGLTDLDGTAPGAKLISQEMGASLQYLNSLGGSIYHAASIAFDNGARIHNNSWGSSCRSGPFQTCIAGCQVEYRQTSRDADAAVWEFPEMALFVAAGNSGGLGGSAGCGPGADIGSGGNAKNVFSIGSNNRGASSNAVSGFSSRGPTQDRRTKPDMTAQGASIISAARNACGTTTLSGTSMATPTAAGLAALVREYLVRGFYPSGEEVTGHAIATPSAALIKAIMVNGSVELTGTGSTGGAPSQSQGWGRVHLDNSLYFEGDERSLWLHDATLGLQTGGVDTHQVVLQEGQTAIFTLTWHDAPALLNANPHGVNQLRLEVQAPGGDVWTQKLPDSGGLNSPNPFQSTTTSGYDGLNNVHQIRFDAPVLGVYQIRIRGIQVAEGPQPYALAVTGDLLGLTDPDFLLQAAPDSVGICAGDSAEYSVGVFSFEGFDDQVTLSVSDLPGLSAAQFSVNPVTPTNPAANSVLTLSDTAALASDNYLFNVNGAANGPGFPAVSKSINLSLSVVADVPSSGTLLTPADSAASTALSPEFSWEAFADATEYQVQVASDADFVDLIIDETVNTTSFTPASALQTSTTYYWRVLGSNQCGAGAASETFSFTTGSIICSAPGLAIPDNSPAGVTDTLVVADSGTLDSLRLQVNVTHTYIGDVQLILSNGDTEVMLVNRPGLPAQGTFGCSGDNMRVFLDDEATLSIQDNCAAGEAFITDGAYTAANPLSAFAGLDLAGSWSLRAVDNAGQDTGTLNSWCLLPALQVILEDAIFGHGFEQTPLQ